MDYYCFNSKRWPPPHLGWEQLPCLASAPGPKIDGAQLNGSSPLKKCGRGRQSPLLVFLRLSFFPLSLYPPCQLHLHWNSLAIKSWDWVKVDSNKRVRFKQKAMLLRCFSAYWWKREFSTWNWNLWLHVETSLAVQWLRLRLPAQRV